MKKVFPFSFGDTLTNIKRRIRMNVFKEPKWCQRKRGKGKKRPMMIHATIECIGSFDFAFFFLPKSKI
jgi:hypothetical protein